MSTPPPPRYRIVERDRRLVVIDTWDKSGTGDIASPPPAVRHGAGRSLAAGAQPAGPIADLLLTIACRGARDDQGRRILTTNASFDTAGPRKITLTASAERRLGTLLLRTAGALAIAAVVLWIFPTLLFLAIVAGGALAAATKSTARPAMTRWLDRLETCASP